MTAKHAMFFALFTQGRVRVTLDARRAGVELPEHLRAFPIVKLDYGLDFPQPTEDIHLGDEGIRCTLSFNQTPTATFVPWAAIYAIEGRTGSGVHFADDMPPEVKQAAAEAQRIALQSENAAAPPPRAQLGLVPQDGEPADPIPAPARATPALYVVPQPGE